MKKFLTKILLVLPLTILSIQVAKSQEVEARIENFRIRLNGGSKYTQTPTVLLEIMASGEPREMRISNHEDFKDNSSWIPFKGNVGQWSFSNGEGEKTIYVQLKDKFGNITPVMKESVIVDRTPPSNPSIKIIAEKGFVNNPNKEVTLELSADDAKYMMISNSRGFIKARWQAFRNSTKWNLEGNADGMREVYVKFMDEAKNETQVISAQILVDSEPPLDVKVLINAGQKVTNDKNGKASLTLFARGASHMKVSTDTTFAGVDWIPYATSMEWKLSQQGKNVVYAKFKDQSNNESKIASNEITWDSTPPEDCSITINDGAKYTEDIDRNVNLKLKAKGAIFMMISNNADFTNAGWIPYKENYRWQLTPGNGEKKVYVRFKDENGNETDVFVGTINQAI
jgi:hypothetical protein